MSTKYCKGCDQTKSVELFEQRGGKPTYRCLECKAKYFAAYYRKNSDKIKDTAKNYRKNNPDKIAQWEEDNREHRREWKKQWINKNRERINADERERRKTDHCYKIKKNLRRRLNEVVKQKADKTMTILGCSVHQLMKHLEAKFTAGMSWDNYGDWHIDHILPCASFDLTKEEEQRKCFHYSNLQPLWAADNIRKGDKVSPQVGPNFHYNNHHHTSLQHY